LPATRIGIREQALLLVGFAGAFRRSELAALDWEDVEERPEGLVVTIRRSKTDAEGQGRKVGIPRGREVCPVAALAAWREESGGGSGPVFRRVDRHSRLLERMSGQAVAFVVKRWAAVIGRDATEFSGHSLRAGLATSAALAGKSERAIMNQTGHRSVTMVRRYIRDGSLFRDNAAEGIGL
jgi:integrase